MATRKKRKPKPTRKPGVMRIVLSGTVEIEYERKGGKLTIVVEGVQPQEVDDD